MINTTKGIKLTLAGVLGNTLEWYDFALYSYNSAILAQLFFPNKSLFISLMITFSVFASGFILRPLGGFILGNLGDKWGRKKALIISMGAMTFVTFLMGCLPSYQSIGLIAPITLILSRIVQGFAISGEFTGVAVFIMEHHQNHRGLIASIAFASCYVGKFMAGFAVSALSSYVTPILLLSGFWHIPYLIGGLFGLWILWLRFHAPESPIFIKEPKHSYPVLIAVKQSPKCFIAAVFICALMAVTSYLIIAYFPIYFTTKLGLTLSQSTFASSISLLVATLLFPFVGAICDSIGRKPVMLFGCFAYLLLAYPGFLLMQNGTFSHVLAGEMLFAVFLAPIAAPLLAILVENFETNVRFSGASFSYNISLALFGGTTPLLAIWLVEKTHNNNMPFILLIAAALITALGIIMLPETYQQKLEQQAGDMVCNG